MARRRRTHPLSIFYAVVVGGFLVGSSLWLDRRGQVVVAPVSSKSEQINVTHVPQGAWYHYYQLGVGVGDAGATPWIATVRVPRDLYDSLRLGDSIAVRYLPTFPLLARTADRSTRTAAWDIVKGLATPFILWAACGVLALLIAARLGTVPVLASALGWMIAGFPMLVPAKEPVVASGPVGEARVANFELVSKSPARRTHRRRHRAYRSDALRRLDMPYQVVQLRVPVSGGTDSVLAVDAVDSGSVRGLEGGAVLPVRYDPRTPREARLTEGTRTFAERNRYHYLPSVIGVPIVGGLVAFGFRLRRRARKKAKNAQASDGILPQAVRTAG